MGHPYLCSVPSIIYGLKLWISMRVNQKKNSEYFSEYQHFWEEHGLPSLSIPRRSDRLFKKFLECVEWSETNAKQISNFLDLFVYLNFVFKLQGFEIKIKNRMSAILETISAWGSSTHKISLPPLRIGFGSIQVNYMQSSHSP